MSMSGVRMLHLADKATDPALMDPVAGHAPRMVIASASGVTSAKQLASAPAIPTLAEPGMPGYDVVQWFGLLVPAGTSVELVARLHAGIGRALREPEAARRLSEDRMEAAPSGSPAELGAFLRAELEKWAKMVRAAGLGAESRPAGERSMALALQGAIQAPVAAFQDDHSLDFATLEWGTDFHVRTGHTRHHLAALQVRIAHPGDRRAQGGRRGRHRHRRRARAGRDPRKRARGRGHARARAPRATRRSRCLRRDPALFMPPPAAGALRSLRAARPLARAALARRALADRSRRRRDHRRPARAAGARAASGFRAVPGRRVPAAFDPGRRHRLFLLGGAIGPERVYGLDRCCVARRREKARECQCEAARLRAIFREQHPSSLKGAMVPMGRAVGPSRPPLPTASRERIADVARQLEGPGVRATEPHGWWQPRPCAGFRPRAPALFAAGSRMSRRLWRASLFFIGG